MASHRQPRRRVERVHDDGLTMVCRCATKGGEMFQKRRPDICNILFSALQKTLAPLSYVSPKDTRPLILRQLRSMLRCEWKYSPTTRRSSAHSDYFGALTSVQLSGPVSTKKECVRTTTSRHNPGRPALRRETSGCLTFSEMWYTAAARIL